MAENFGGISLAEIETSSREQPFPDNAGASPDTRFLTKVSALVSTRQEQGENGGFTVFLKSEALQTDALASSGIMFPSLANGNDPICNKVWLSNTSLAVAYSIDVDCTDQSRLFQEIVARGLGALPALLVDWRGNIPQGQFFANGCNDLDAVESVELTYVEITRDVMKACLDHATSTSLETPALTRSGHSEPIWTNAAKGWPAHRPEERIQGKIIHHLRSRFTKHVVRAEQHNDDGISDLVVFARRHDASGRRIIVNEWVLELKALTDRTESGTVVPSSNIKTRVSDGLVQAIAYRTQEHARQAALCCFDMRAEDEGDDACFRHVATTANAKDVELWRWFLYRATKDRRSAADKKEKVSTALQR
jgi:hypothetical protein